MWISVTSSNTGDDNLESGTARSGGRLCRPTITWTKDRPMSCVQRIVAMLVPAMLAMSFYSVVHEAGHLLPALAFGIEVKGVTWTVFGGQSPHVSLGDTPRWAMAWIDAGGLLLPTLLGSVLMTAWLAVRRRCSPALAAWLWIPGLTMLCGNIGLLIEVFAPAWTTHSHMRSLSIWLGLSGITAGMLELLPLIPTVLFTVLFCRTWKETRARLRSS